MSIRKRLRAYLLPRIWKTHRSIPQGVRGELSKINEELLELEDAAEYGTKLHEFIEGCDLLDSTFRYQWRHHHVPMVAAVLVVYIRRLWKPCRNLFLDWIELYRDDVIAKSE